MMDCLMDWSWWGSEWAKRGKGREGGRELKRGGRGGRERERIWKINHKSIGPNDRKKRSLALHAGVIYSSHYFQIEVHKL